MNYLYIVAACVLLAYGLGCRDSGGEGNSLRADSVDEVSRLSEAPECAEEDINRFANGATPLYWAAFDLDAEAVKRLLTSGADVNKGTENGHTPLHGATERESEEVLEIVKILVSHGADVNAKVPGDRDSNAWAGKTPLHNAASVSLLRDDLEPHGNVAVVEYLLAHGADVNARDAWGCTPLFDSLFAGNLAVTKLLVAHGAELNLRATEDGATVLHDAASIGDLEAVKLFVSHGADISARDFDGETSLHEAALRRDREAVDYLVSQGADLHAPSKRGETPQDFLDEPNDVEPVLLAGRDTYPLTLIRTDRLHVRLMLKSAGVDYDTLWTPSASDIEGLDRSLRRWLEEEPSDTKGARVDPEYVLSHFDRYHREYAGFVKDGSRYIFGSMVQVSTDDPVRGPLRNAFVSVLGRGCVQARAIFAAQSKTVVVFRCGRHATPETTAP
ncbi:MAG: ankyrin repeat domain-containing protein [Sedimentisphaerales bacterium]|jgi:ankyrin repeat protein|nr:ankyrin repeat domain-containing protein [Sedimentisphaerales bacterium]HNY80469.1 ankyrin repeat domain-containing protein [Sedimentisphaerales bacterium]HOC65195.1 ankyrin repeat domain-containing protein [Sedimentisphaerales bacterium]HOH66197.1 ankyrin repeat domain-containing protein [Sedimentisphaerales bacterium]HQA89379.1 ankyrin repeat domain-containing protein [Sedimentisphaerales bacterium]